MNTMTFEQMNDELHVLGRNSVHADTNEFSVPGVESWVSFDVNAESDWVISVVRQNGVLFSVEGYGLSPFSEQAFRPLDEVFNREHFIDFISEGEDFETHCCVSSCDSWLDENCVEHTVTTAQQDRIWELANLMIAHL